MPIEFRCVERLPQSPEQICDEIADLERWPSFRGFGPLPGVESASWERRTESMVDSVVRVKNLDGSRHAETILEWSRGRRIVMRMDDFSPPLRSLAERFEESWDFHAEPGETIAVRQFRLHPRGRVAWLALYPISLLLRAAVARHMREIAAGVSNSPKKT